MNITDRSAAYKGVSARGKKWRAQICVNGRRLDLGTFSTPEEAARAYDSAARLHFGDFARCNFAG
jgi:hypothetical protein